MATGEQANLRGAWGGGGVVGQINPTQPGEFFVLGYNLTHGGFIKGSLTRDFRLQVFFINQFPPGP
jgi:hypothetical protein